MARAISSLPTPDSPSTSTGMFEPAAFSALRSTASIFGLRVTMSLNVSVPEWLRLMRCNSSASAPFSSGVAQRHLEPLGADRLDHEIGRARAHRRHHIVDAAMRGLHDHRHVLAGLAHARQHAEAIEIGHDEIEHHAVEALAVRSAASRPASPLSAIDRLVAELPHHVVEQAALDGIVIDDENTRGHGQHSKRNCAVSRQSARVALRGR